MSDKEDHAADTITGHTNGLIAEVATLRARIVELEVVLADAESSLLRKGYRKSCDIPACNCGDQWNHGGHANERLSEISEVLGCESTNGVTILDAVRRLIAEATDA